MQVEIVGVRLKRIYSELSFAKLAALVAYNGTI